MSARPVTSDAAWQPRVIALVCQWCSSAGADMAGTTRLQYPANVRLLRLPCTGRMSPLFILKAFEHGADGVLVSGCHPGDCHYIQGNMVARRRFLVFRSLLELLGLDPRRLHFAWVSAAEGQKWARVVRDVTAAVRQAGPLVGWASPPAEAVPPQPPREINASPLTPTPESTVQRLRETAAALLRDGEVSLVLGYQAGSLPGQVTPAFVETPEAAANLIFSSESSSNLSVYLRRALERHQRAAVLLKACDVRATVGLLQEGQIQRDRVVLVGVPCTGVGHDGKPQDKCASCSGEPSPLCDVTVPGWAHVRSQAQDPRDAELAWLESCSPVERHAYWQAQLSRCLRCYACRAVCPLCTCPTCIAEKHRPQWIPTSIDGRGNTAWNIVRALHLAGRCGGCDECARVCPAGIRLDLLNRKLTLEVERHFGYRAGEDPGAPPVMTTFRDDDPGEMFL